MSNRRPPSNSSGRREHLLSDAMGRSSRHVGLNSASSSCKRSSKTARIGNRKDSYHHLQQASASLSRAGWRRLLTSLLLAGTLLSPGVPLDGSSYLLGAQEPQAAMQVVDGKPVVVQPGNAPGQPPQAGSPPQPGAPPPGTPNAPPATAESPIVKRPAAPPEPPNKKEFEVKPDENGMVEFQFRNQAWPDILRWLAETSNVSLDWQELPSDYLNIATQRKQSLEDTRDMINRHLLSRGFTMLELDGVIQVVKTAGINVSLVPKVPVAALASLPPNRFVRTTFTLKSLISKDCATEFKPMLSSNGVLTPLTATNRLEAMDSAANLAEIARLIEEEESEDSIGALAKEFELQFVRAADIREQLMAFLGIESKQQKPSGRASPEEMMMRQQQMQMEMQMQMQRANQPGGAPPSPSKDIYLVANVRRNSIIAHAPPDKMAIISAFIMRVDVPNENSASMQRMESRMRTYRLSSLDPKQFVVSIGELDALEPTTRLFPDEKNSAIIAYASLSDHLIIAQTIERLDGSARDFEVIQLRRLRAEEVAGTIKFLMIGDDDKKKNSNNSRMYYFNPFGGNNDQEKESNDKFRVGANVQDNQILLWANESEIQEVTKLLEKLGEIPPSSGMRSNIRTIDASRSQETKAYLQRLQTAWAKVSDKPLKLPDDSEFEPDPAPVAGTSNAESPSAASSKTNTSKNKTPNDDSVKAIPPGDQSKDSGSDKSDDGEKSKETKSSSSDVSEVSRTEQGGTLVVNEPKDAPELLVQSNHSGTESSENSDTDVEEYGRKAASLRGLLSNVVYQDDASSNLSSGEGQSEEEQNSLPTGATRANNQETSTAADVSNQPRLGVQRSVNHSVEPMNSGLEIKFDERGNLILSGNDLDALDRLESMMTANSPPLRKYEVFYIQHTKPSWIEINLKDYFKEEDEKKDTSNEFMSWYFGFDSDTKKSSSSDPQLGKSRKLKFISDSDTQSIVVMGADEQQLKTIESLIKLWDVPQKTSKQKLRFSKLVRVEHSKAGSIVDAIKDAYRDLLSTNDKAFQKGGKDGKSESKHEDDSASVTESGGMSYNFTGRLSMGIEPLTNSIIVSAEGEDLLKLVIEMIKELDVAAQPSGAIQMVEVGGTNSVAMERALKAMMGRKDTPPLQPGQPNQNGAQNGNGQFPGGQPGAMQVGGASSQKANSGSSDSSSSGSNSND